MFWGLLKKLKSELHCVVIIRPHKVSVSSTRSPFFIIAELQKHFGQRNAPRPDVNKKKAQAGSLQSQLAVFGFFQEWTVRFLPR